MLNDNSVELVTIGTWVKVMEHGSGDEEVFYIVASSEADHLENKIPPENPMARVMLGSKSGDDVVLDGPNGQVKFSILEIGRQ